MLKSETARSRIEELYDKDEWNLLLLEHRLLGSSSDGVLWSKPDADDLVAIADFARSRGKAAIVSIGCGSGLLEWLIHRATGMKVHGVEVNPNYWLSSYRRVFLDRMSFPGDSDFVELTQSPGVALMFSYFNSRPAFDSYLDGYAGDSVIIVGPGEGSGRHSEPCPLAPDFKDMAWKRHSARPMGSTGDCIAFYTR